jgi:hypothetical protein
MVESNKYIHAIDDDDDTLLNAVKTLRENKCGIDEVYTPFPVHGLDKVMGINETRIAIMSFIYGCIGLSIAVIMINFIMIEDWPHNIGVSGQVEAIRLALARALCLLNEDNRKVLKPERLLTRDSRNVERKKYGRKKARKNFQFSKR